MRYLLNAVYLLLLALAAPWLTYIAWTSGKYREGWWERWTGRVNGGDFTRPRIWLHAVSVGEVNLLAPLVAELERRLPEYELVISATTRTGHDLACRKYAPRTVFYAPLDFSWAVAAAMRRVQPRMVVLAELELWPNLIAQARRNGIPVAVINGRLSEASYRGYRRIRRWLQPTLNSLELVAAQNDTYAARFQELGVPACRVAVTGSIKFDGAPSQRDNPRTQQLVDQAGIAPEQLVFLAGSTQAPEEVLALQSYRQLVVAHPRLRLVMVPRHPERFNEVARMLEAAGVSWQRRSRLGESGDQLDWQVLLVDTVGELGAWWGRANVALVGGSLGSRGGQNMIEPAAYGAAVCFGPNTRNFRDIVAALLA
ncbi:unnamed protein product, partial [marine sediment metagenome]